MEMTQVPGLGSQSSCSRCLPWCVAAPVTLKGPFFNNVQAAVGVGLIAICINKNKAIKNKLPTSDLCGGPSFLCIIEKKKTQVNGTAIMQLGMDTLLLIPDMDGL